LSLTFNVDNGLVLLFDQHGHLGEHLCELGEGLFDLLDFGMSFLDFSVCTSGSAISVGVEELYISPVSVYRLADLQPGRRLGGYHFP
jgi:hypothetical protein